MGASRINITIGTAGHIDHGKTALIKCLTGCETDRLREEKERGMSIELGFAPCTVGDLQVGIVDVPGHENFIKTMVAGASGIDGVIFVVAADDGVMPQTREHLDILTLLGVRRGVVALTKIDRIEPELIELVTDDVRAVLRGTFLEDAPIIPVSNTTGVGFGALIDALTAMIRTIEPRRCDGVFRVPVERAFSVQGYGTVVSGVPAAGAAKVGDEVELLPQKIAGRIRAAQVYGQDSDIVLAGQCAALNVRQWDHHEIDRGNVIATPGYFDTTQWGICDLTLLARERFTLKNGTKMRFHTGTAETPASVYLLDCSEASAGDRCLVQVRFDHPIIIAPGDRFIIRCLSPVHTVGGGVVVEAESRRLRRSCPGLVEDLKERSAAVVEPARFVEYCIKVAQDCSISTEALARRAKVPPTALEPMVARLCDGQKAGRLSDGTLMHADVVERLSREAVDAIGRFHEQSPDSPGLTREALSEACGWRPTVCEAIVDRLLRSDELVETARRLAVPGRGEQMSDGQRELLESAERLYRRRLFQPPGRVELAAALGAAERDAEQLIRMLRERDRLVEVAPAMMFHREAVDEARRRLVADIREHGELESVKFKYLLDTTRKFAIPLLDYFDRIGVTLRRGNTRYLGRAAKSDQDGAA